MKKHLLFILAVLLPLFISAETIQIDGIWYNLTIENRQAEVVQGTSKYTGDITIPAVITYGEIDFSVTSIGVQAFYKNTSLTSISLPNSVVNIGNRAFEGCTTLATATMGNNVLSIGEYAFYGCSQLVAFPLPESLTEIGGNAFEGCRKFSSTTIVIPNGVTTLKGGVFRSCNLKAIVLHKNFERIENWALVGNSYNMNVYCHAETPPTVGELGFVQQTKEYINSYIAAHDDFVLHVPSTAVQDYKNKSPWKYFKSIESLIELVISQTTATLTEGETLRLTATVTPNETEDQTVTWSSSNSNVASVSDEGVVTALMEGTTTITATACDGSYVKAACEVTVEKGAEIIPTVVDITINKYGSGTYSSKYALDFSKVEGLKAYAATAYNNITGVVTLTRVKTSQAGTGLFVKGDAGSYEVPIIASSADNTLNMLVATLEETFVDALSSDGLYANYKYTILEDEEGPKFYRFADGSSLSAGKAYLQIPLAWLPTAQARSINYRFDDGTSTDIKDATNENARPNIIYDLMGRRVKTPQRGSMYIINGTKTIY